MARMFGVALAVLALTAASAGARRAPLPGVVTPTGNIRCLYVPVAHLLCDVAHSAYAAELQRRCQARTGLDWHGFTLPATRPAVANCTGGILWNEGSDVPVYRRLAYGAAWRFGAFTCVSRRTGLTCTSRYGHGLFLSRASWRGW